MKPIILLGGGGHCKSVINVIESTGRTLLGILDMPEDVGATVLSTKVVGTDDDIPTYARMADFIITVGFIKNTSTRLKLYDRVKDAGGHLVTVIAPSANVSPYAKIGEGTVVLHQATVNADSTVGNNVIINSHSNIEHDVVINDHCHISTGAMVNGGCRIGRACFIGSGAVIGNGVKIADNVIIGAGSVVLKDIVDSGTYYGNPLRKIR